MKKIIQIVFALCFVTFTMLNCDSEPTEIGTIPPPENPDIDNDGVPDAEDNCLNIANPNQEDINNNGIGDVCENVTPLSPCENGMADIYPCNGIDLLAIIDAETLGGALGAEGSDIWGWVDPSNGNEYALVSLTNSTAFVNVTDPTNPIFLILL